METKSIKSLEKMIDMYNDVIHKMTNGEDTEEHEIVSDILMSLILSNEVFIEKNTKMDFEILECALMVNSHRLLLHLTEEYNDDSITHIANKVFLKIYN